MVDDLISRQAAIDAMAELQGRAYTKAELKGISKAWKRIKQLPSAEPKKGKWIPTSKKYPTPWTLVWVTDKRGRVNVCQMGHNENQYWFDKDEEWIYEHDAIVAWMPYCEPEPYRGEE